MELVNKMELLKQLADKLNNSHWYSETEEGFEAAMSMLEDAPTVDAIPVEWIEKQIGKALDVDSCDMFYARNLKYLIKEWRKENEQIGFNN